MKMKFCAFINKFFVKLVICLFMVFSSSSSFFVEEAKNPTTKLGNWTYCYKKK